MDQPCKQKSNFLFLRFLEIFEEYFLSQQKKQQQQQLLLPKPCFFKFQI